MAKTGSISPITIVEASAGSGKTRELALQYLRLVFGQKATHAEEVIRSILAVTFTNKAALEMKERILSFLKTLALERADRAERKKILSALGMTEEETAARAEKTLDAILAAYSFFRVQTIDSLTNTILTGCSFALGRSARPVIRTDHTRYLVRSFDELLDAAADDPSLRRQFETYLRQTFLDAGRVNWFPARPLAETVRGLYEWHTRLGKMPAPTKSKVTPATLDDRARKLAQELCSLVSTDQITVHAYNALEKVAQEGLRLDRIGTALEKTELPLKKSASASQKAHRVWRELRQTLSQKAEIEAFAACDPVVGIFERTVRGLEKAAQEEDIIFVQELAARAFDLIAAGVTPPEIYLRLAGRFRHYLFDEFQDTSRLHWENLLPLVEDAVASGGTLFVVGDRKQTIFRFAGGAQDLFDDVVARFSGDSSGRCARRTLDVNYRGVRGLVEFVNSVFSAEKLGEFLATMREQGRPWELSDTDLAQVQDVFKDAVQTAHRPGKGRVIVQQLDETGSEEPECDWAVAQVNDAKRVWPLDAISVLCRKNAEVELVTERLISEQIPAASERTLNIRRNPTVRQILAFLSFLNSPPDDLPFSAFVEGDVFTGAAEMSPQEISSFFLAAGREKRTAGTPFYLSFRRRYPEVWKELIEPFFAQVGYLPPYELVCGIFRTYRLAERCAGEHGFLMKLLEVVKNAEEEFPDIASFLAYVEEGPDEDFFVGAPAAGAVTVTTVHKAKGQQFPVVILPFFSLDIRVADPQLPLVPVATDDGLRIIRLTQAPARFSDRVCEIYRRQYRACLLDELNVAYVALTRAQEELRVLVNKKDPAGRFLPVIDTGKPAGAAKKEKKEGVGRLAGFTPDDWLGRLREEFATADAIRSRKRRLEGEVVHAVLARIEDLDGKNEAETVRQAVAAVKPLFPRWQEWERTEELTLGFVCHPEARQIFSCAGKVVRCEAEVVDAEGNTHRIDRLMVGKEEVIVVDYTLGEEDSAKETQVKGYLALVRQLYPGKRVRGLIASVVNPSVREVNG